MSRVHRTCAFRRLKPGDDDSVYRMESDYQYTETWCGERRLMSSRERDKPQRHANCPACAKALGAAGLAKLPGRVELTKAPEGSEQAKRYKSAWLFALDGVPRGWITNERGFGKPWDLELLPTARDSWRGTGGSVAGDPPPSYRPEARIDGATFHAIHYAARDAMAVAAVRAAERGELPTVEERAEREAAATLQREADERQREADRDARLARLEREAAEREERRSTAILALESLETRADLSNVELAGIAAMRALLGV